MNFHVYEPNSIVGRLNKEHKKKSTPGEQVGQNIKKDFDQNKGDGSEKKGGKRKIEC